MADTRFPRRFGKYILLDRINAGGMAEVYRAKVTGVEQFERLVAIKCMLPSLVADGQFISMFIDEAKLASQLSHPNVVQIYELGRFEDQLYIAMELVNGRDLRHIVRTALRQKTKLSIGFAAYVIAKAAEGLDFAHRKVGVDGRPLNLVHRDVSPQNILVSYDGEVKVVDFGIAKAEARATETQAGVLKGKFAYMAPEQVSGREIDRRVDIFALGAVLYEVLTGNKLFTGESDLSILDKVRRAEVPTIASHVPDAPEELEAVLKRALARDKNERFAYAAELAEALEPLLIENRSIFGAKKAAALMQQLYAEEINLLAMRQREWARVGGSEVDEAAAAQKAMTSTQVFESAFGGEVSSASVPQTVSVSAPHVPQTVSVSVPGPQKTVVLSPSELSSAPKPVPEPVVAKTEMMTAEDLKNLQSGSWGGAPVAQAAAPVAEAPKVSSAAPDWTQQPTQMLDVSSKSGVAAAHEKLGKQATSTGKQPTAVGAKSKVQKTPARKSGTSPLIIVGIVLCALVTVAAVVSVLYLGKKRAPAVVTPVPITDVTPPAPIASPAPVPVKPEPSIATEAKTTPVAIPVPASEPRAHKKRKR